MAAEKKDTDYREVIGRTFAPRFPKDDQTQDKRYLGIKSLSTGKIVNCTLWDNSHGHVEVEEGDLVFASGAFSRREGNDGKVYNNISIYEIAVIPTDKGKRKDSDEADTSDDGDVDDKPEVM